MLSKLIVFGVGYVLGSKAGRARYNQIAALAQGAARRLEDYGARNQSLTSNSWGNFRIGDRATGQTRIR
jgi:hypothetical protein